MRRFHWLFVLLLALAWGVVVGTLMGRVEEMPSKGTLSPQAQQEVWEATR